MVIVLVLLPRFNEDVKQIPKRLPLFIVFERFLNTNSLEGCKRIYERRLFQLALEAYRVNKRKQKEKKSQNMYG